MIRRQRFFSMIPGLRFSRHGWTVLRCAVLPTAGSAWSQGFYVLTTSLHGPTDVLSLGLKKMPAGLTVAASVSVEDGEAPRLEIVQ